MNLSFDKFKIILSKLNAKISQDASCPMKQNQICLQNSSNCTKGKENNCMQRLSLSLNNRLFYIEVIYYGKDRKGFINSESTSVRNFVIRNKIDLDELK